jgi:hypothetical protein
MEWLAGELTRLPALALGLKEGWCQEKIDQHISNMTANYNPAQRPPEPGQLRKGMHSNWGR